MNKTTGNSIICNFKTLLIDCDGVLTDGTLVIDAVGEKLFKKFHTKDIRAIREFVARGIEVVIVSADDWEGIYHFAEKVGATVHICRDKSSLPFEDYIAVGDDAWDVGMLENAKQSYVPADADWSVTRKEVVKLRTEGGRGVIAELLQLIFYSR